MCVRGKKILCLNKTVMLMILCWVRRWRSEQSSRASGDGSRNALDKERKLCLLSTSTEARERRHKPNLYLIKQQRDCVALMKGQVGRLKRKKWQRMMDR